jgi:hypothetical protein
MIMAKTVPLRQLEVFQTDDGRRIEAYTRIKDIAPGRPNEPEADDNKYEQNETIYVGHIQFMHPQYGPQELKFHMEKATTLDQACEMFFEHAQESVKKVEERRKAAEQQESKIISAPAEALSALDQMAEQNPGKIIV